MSIGEGIIPRINNIKEGDVFKNLRIFHNILSHLGDGYVVTNTPGSEVIKLFLLFNSVEHEIFSANKC